MLRTETLSKSILTRSTGYLSPICSHSLQPYRGCALGSSLCGVSCYVQHSPFLTRGHPWGSFLDIRTNSPTLYQSQYTQEKSWAHRHRPDAKYPFSIFLSSSTEPFQPAEQKYRLTRQILESMLTFPPDELILQSHSHHLADYLDLYLLLFKRCNLRLHLTIESDRDTLPGLPPPASSVAKRLAAAQSLHNAGLTLLITLSPLLPIDNPHLFFQTLSPICTGIVIDHFIQGDGTPTGSRTRKTPLPQAMELLNPISTTLAYRDQIISIAREHLPNRVGIGATGFAGHLS